MAQTQTDSLKEPKHAIILFDGICNLCTWSVQFVLPRDPYGYFQFASLQSPFGQSVLKNYQRGGMLPDSVVLIEDSQMYFKSDAALRIARNLSGLWSLARILQIVPRALRDWAYDWIAAHRYKIFGTRDSCLVNFPNAEERFLDSVPASTR
jgi:predicted DCC family thiol-disulfide oxidoreductase YuxK